MAKAKKTTRRPKGEGSIQLLPNGRYKMTITIGTSIDKKQRRKSVTADTKEELLDKAAKLRLTYNVMAPEEKKASLEKKTYEEMSEEWYKTNTHLAKGTINQYKKMDKNHIYPYIGHLCLVNITGDVCDNLLIRCQEQGLAPNTINAVRKRISTIFNYLIRKRILTENPLTFSTFTIKERRRKAEFPLPSEEKMKELLTTLKKKSPLRLYPLVVTAIMTGMRRGEIFGLKWSKIDTKKKTIKVDSQVTASEVEAPLKTTSSYRTIYISQKLLDVLETIPKESEYVFYNPQTHSPLSFASTSTIKNICIELGFPNKFTFHDFRHYHATQLMAKGVNIKVLSRRLGHKDIATTLDLYVNYMPSLDEESSTLMDDIIE